MKMASSARTPAKGRKGSAIACEKLPGEGMKNSATLAGSSSQGSNLTERDCPKLDRKKYVLKKQKVSLDLKAEKLRVETSLRHEFHKVLPEKDIATQHDGEPDESVDQFASLDGSEDINRGSN